MPEFCSLLLKPDVAGPNTIIRQQLKDKAVLCLWLLKGSGPLSTTERLFIAEYDAHHVPGRRLAKGPHDRNLFVSENNHVNLSRRSRHEPAAPFAVDNLAHRRWPGLTKHVWAAKDLLTFTAGLIN